jgi:hypothetical protein
MVTSARQAGWALPHRRGNDLHRRILNPVAATQAVFAALHELTGGSSVSGPQDAPSATVIPQKRRTDDAGRTTRGRP